MTITKSEVVSIVSESEIVLVRQKVRLLAEAIKLGLVDQTKIVTAASELARNTLVHGGGGSVLLEIVQNSSGEGLRLCFEDQGQGIPDIELAMRDRFTTGSGMGLGLGGSKRLVHDFEIESTVGKGTRITITKWKNFK